LQHDVAPMLAEKQKYIDDVHKLNLLKAGYQASLNDIQKSAIKAGKAKDKVDIRMWSTERVHRHRKIPALASELQHCTVPKLYKELKWLSDNEYEENVAYLERLRNDLTADDYVKNHVPVVEFNKKNPRIYLGNRTGGKEVLIGRLTIYYNLETDE